jgi:TusA-related sulfurtransferase
MFQQTPPGARNTSAVLDAGGDSPRELSGSLYRCIDDLLPGQVLEVISRDPASRRNICEWCALTGHRLLWSEKRAGESLCWIEKR